MSKIDYIGIFGGSFDPIHKGHIESLKSVTEKLNLSKVLVIPNKVSPLKDLSVASSLEKIKMLEIAFKDFKEIEIEDYELKKEGPSFMIETLQYLEKKLGKKKHFLLIIGEDSFQSFNRWKNYQHIIKMTSLLVMNRPGLKNDLTTKAIELHQDCIENTYGDNIFKKGKRYLLKETSWFRMKTNYSGKRFLPAKYAVITGDKALSPNNVEIMKKITVNSIIIKI